ncbi:hypothetical protein G5V59_19480 [Nocardioides sp. W3-2-3]|uniref:hypothetical protein n=1 Tax=Nocardioides convexus TaxID=2712224 RepID=UPI0024186439|nr:hypothetical protein [Nocardioides convexus]NHA01297.1 hypothetical protein [Nocardioides convexus]
MKSPAASVDVLSDVVGLEGDPMPDMSCDDPPSPPHAAKVRPLATTRACCCKVLPAHLG